MHILEEINEKPIIGVMPLYDDEKKSLWMLPGYLDCITDAGGIPFVFPLNVEKSDLHRLYKLCDGILLTGGHDVNPELYGEDKLAYCGKFNRQRDEIETYIFKQAYKDNKAMLGICRGIQLMNVLMGGTLYQDIEQELLTDVRIKHQMEPPYDRGVHKIRIVKGTPMYSLLKKPEITVNSYHHQAVKKCGNSLIPMAFSPDGVVEAICCKRKKFIWGIQWHPEFFAGKDKPSKIIFSEFIKQCKK